MGIPKKSQPLRRGNGFAAAPAARVPRRRGASLGTLPRGSVGARRSRCLGSPVPGEPGSLATVSKKVRVLLLAFLDSLPSFIHSGTPNRDPRSLRDRRGRLWFWKREA